ncbi:MAG: tripartite tricarboxylate transporter TctB family protein, partial [Bilophila sp.]
FFYCNIESWVLETLPATISPAFFPLVVTGILVFMSGVLLFFSVKSLHTMLTGQVDKERLDLQEGGEEAGRFTALFGYVGIMFLYLVALHYIGFLYSTPFIMLLVSLMLGLRHYVMGMAVYVLFTLALDYAALNFMQIILPTGVLFQ